MRPVTLQPTNKKFDKIKSPEDGVVIETYVDIYSDVRVNIIWFVHFIQFEKEKSFKGTNKTHTTSIKVKDIFQIPNRNFINSYLKNYSSKTPKFNIVLIIFNPTFHRI